MNKGIKKSISAWALIGLLTAGFFYRLEIIEIAVSQAAEYFGLQIGAIEISHINFDSIAIARLDMSYQDSALRLDTQISALQICFNLPAQYSKTMHLICKAWFMPTSFPALRLTSG